MYKFSEAIHHREQRWKEKIKECSDPSKGEEEQEEDMEDQGRTLSNTLISGSGMTRGGNTEGEDNNTNTGDKWIRRGPKAIKSPEISNLICARICTKEEKRRW